MSTRVAAPPAPAVEYNSPLVQNAVWNTLLFQLKAATTGSLQHDEIVRQRREEIARRQAEINHSTETIRKLNERINALEAENSQAHVECQEAERISNEQLELAKGYADSLVALGAQIPPDQIEVLRNGNVMRLARHHDELNAEQKS